MPLLIAAVALALAPSHAFSFGTIWGSIGGSGPFHAEHEAITRAALSCGVPDKVPNCFEPVSLDNLAGKWKTFGAVGAPDNYSGLSGGPDYWHCDGGDAFQGVLPDYPVALGAARDKLSECRDYAYAELNLGANGLKGRRFPAAITHDGAVGGGRFLLSAQGQVDANDLSTSACTFDLTGGRAKCHVLESFGRGLHVIQDFYSHSNWVDRPASGAVSLTNPPGLGNSAMATAFWNMNVPSAAVPAGLGTGCYPTARCAGRVTHDEGLAKDRVLINWRNGLNAVIDCTGKCTPRGLVNGNEARAVRAAIQDTRRQWADLQTRIIRHEGVVRGERIICAIHRDAITTACNQAGAAAGLRVEAAPVVPAAPRAATGNATECGSVAVRPGVEVTRIRATGTSCHTATWLVRAAAGVPGRAEAVAVQGTPYTSVFTEGRLRGVRMTVDVGRTVGSSVGRLITFTRDRQRVDMDLACASASEGGDSTCGF